MQRYGHKCVYAIDDSILIIRVNRVGAGVYMPLSLPVTLLILCPGGALVCILILTLVSDLTLLAMIAGPLAIALRHS